MKNHCDSNAGLLDHLRHNVDDFRGALRRASHQKPAIIVLGPSTKIDKDPSHYVFCEGPMSSCNNTFVVLDPRGAECHEASLKAGPKLSASGMKDVGVQGLIVTGVEVTEEVTVKRMIINSSESKDKCCTIL